MVKIMIKKSEISDPQSGSDEQEETSSAEVTGPSKTLFVRTKPISRYTYSFYAPAKWEFQTPFAYFIFIKLILKSMKMISII